MKKEDKDAVLRHVQEAIFLLESIKAELAKEEAHAYYIKRKASMLKIEAICIDACAE